MAWILMRPLGELSQGIKILELAKMTPQITVYFSHSTVAK